FARGPKIGDDGTRGNYGLPGGGPAEASRGVTTASALPPLPVWRVDPESGYWVPMGDMGKLVESGTEPGRYGWEVTLKSAPYLFAVALPFWWRSPAASLTEPLRPPEPAWLESSCLEVRVEDTAGQPAAGRLVVARGVDYVSMTRALTDASGRARLEVMRGRKVKVDAGEEPVVVDAGGEPGNCRGKGAEPVPVSLEVPVRTCTPGAELECAYGGPTGTRGVGACREGRQVCNANGTGWSDTCEGEVRPTQESCDTPQDDDCDGTVNETCASICQEGETRPCYEGPEGTGGVGQCQMGTQTCVARGTAWSACKGQVLPEAEDCSRPGDEDCDGVTCQCWPAERQRCGYTGPEETEDVGLCRASTRACNTSGTGWGACGGEVPPQAEEDCTTAGDDDCDGEANEGTACLCAPGTSRSCYSGPAGTLGVGVCTAGTETCNTSGTAWGACEGEVPPGAEICSNSVDDDCDGQSNENPPCIWAVTGSLDSPRQGHTATLLANGKVLVTGGRTSSANLQTAELYDPALGSWSSTGSMNSPHPGHTATILSDGKVLVSGGGIVTTADVYDPALGSWSSAGTMNWPRTAHTATRLDNGKVLVAGGQDINGSLQAAEVYDPATNSWSPAATMSSPRAAHTATLLDNGMVLISGGGNSSGLLQKAEVYDPAPSS
ncbi:MAG TPA: kelch repeat-containing protein, partial [Archangium sp.]|nr:kelch repeat-containing protein [Archangium sp.]